MVCGRSSGIEARNTIWLALRVPESTFAGRRVEWRRVECESVSRGQYERVFAKNTGSVFCEMKKLQKSIGQKLWPTAVEAIYTNTARALTLHWREKDVRRSVGRKAGRQHTFSQGVLQRLSAARQLLGKHTRESSERTHPEPKYTPWGPKIDMHRWITDK